MHNFETFLLNANKFDADIVFRKRVVFYYN